jgi:nucleoside-diphosphate-sugar epimerase
VARALIVGCGCRGRLLGQRLLVAGWAVRGTSRSEGGLAPIEESGIEPASADPLRPGDILELVADVAVVHWLLGSVEADDEEEIAAIHGERLERLLERLVDTPVRGFVYEAAGTVPARHLERGRGAVEAASARWRIPIEIVEADAADGPAWAEAMLAATARLADRQPARYG